MRRKEGERNERREGPVFVVSFLSFFFFLPSLVSAQTLFPFHSIQTTLSRSQFLPIRIPRSSIQHNFFLLKEEVQVGTAWEYWSDAPIDPLFGDTTQSADPCCCQNNENFVRKEKTFEPPTNLLSRSLSKFFILHDVIPD